MATKAELQAVIDILGKDPEIQAAAITYQALEAYHQHYYLPDSSKTLRRQQALRVLKMVAVRMGISL